MMRILFILLLTSTTFAATLYIGQNQSYPNLHDAAQFAQPGDSLVFLPGEYESEQYIDALQGNTDKWIYITALKESETIIHGGDQAWHLSNPQFVHISGIVFTDQKQNGVNIDDGGDYSTPAQHVKIVKCDFLNMQGTSNNDLLKLSGLDNFEITDCVFLNGADGGSGIDMVGCHDGKIEISSFENMGSNAIQAKGGSQNITIEANYFRNCGQRSLNIGGSNRVAVFPPAGCNF